MKNKKKCQTIDTNSRKEEIRNFMKKMKNENFEKNWFKNLFNSVSIFLRKKIFQKTIKTIKKSKKWLKNFSAKRLTYF